MKIFIIVLSVFLISGCSSSYMMMDREYQDRKTISTSLFDGDNTFINEGAVEQILSSKIKVLPKSKVAIFKYESVEDERFARYQFGYYYWRTENYIKLQQNFVDTLQYHLLSSGRVIEATTLPSIIISKQPTIGMIRQAAVRLQAELVLIFKITSDVYYDYNLFSKDNVKAYSNCEALLFDTRTGIVPFSTVKTRDTLMVVGKNFVDREEAEKYAQRVACLSAINAVGVEVEAFLKNSP